MVSAWSCYDHTACHAFKIAQELHSRWFRKVFYDFDARCKFERFIAKGQSILRDITHH